MSTIGIDILDPEVQKELRVLQERGDKTYLEDIEAFYTLPPEFEVPYWELWTCDKCYDYTGCFINIGAFHIPERCLEFPSGSRMVVRRAVVQGRFICKQCSEFKGYRNITFHTMWRPL